MGLQLSLIFSSFFLSYLPELYRNETRESVDQNQGSQSSKSQAWLVYEYTEIRSFVRGYHAYQHLWTPVTQLVKREPDNPKDRNAVAVYQEEAIVGHVPFNLAVNVSKSLSRSTNKAFAEITGERINRGGGYGLAIACIYKF